MTMTLHSRAPITLQTRETDLRIPSFCDELRVRDILDNVVITTTGEFVATYELSGIHSQYHDDDIRNRTKESLEALLRATPERSMRMHLRFEIRQDAGSAVDSYIRASRATNSVLLEIDGIRQEQWEAKEKRGEFLNFRIHLMLHWDPRTHHAQPGREWEEKLRSRWTLSVGRSVQRAQHEHERLLSEFNSIIAGIETTLTGTGMEFRRLLDDDLFVLIQQSLNPCSVGDLPHLRPNVLAPYGSIRSRIANVSVEGEADEYLKVGGLLYSFLTLKDPPDATHPGILRELLALDFPIIVSTEIAIPDQAKVINRYKWQQRKMTAAQRDINGGFRVNVEAQVAERQLIKVLEEVISSSLKACQVSLTVGIRTSKPIETQRDIEHAERTLADRRQRVLYTIARMGGARAMVETLAQRRMFIGSVPTMAEENKREIDMLTLNAADLMPLEAPWQGTPNSPGILFETRQRKLIPFSPFDSSFTDANMLITSSSGGGKTFMAQMFLLMLSRLNPLISIIERGDSYAALTELMGGHVIEVDLEGSETLNPWDLPPSESGPTKDKIAFLKNLSRHMIGESRETDPTLLDSVLGDAITRVYRRVGMRSTQPIPTFGDLCDELANWRSGDRVQSTVAERSIGEAQFAALKLRDWTGEKGTYSKLFDRHTSIRTDSSWLFFNVEGLSNDPRLETAMSMLIANAMAERSSGRSGHMSITVLDECWALLDSSVLAPEVVQLFRTARKRNASVWGISQAIEDFVGTEKQPRIHGPGIIKNASTKIIGQQRGDLSALANHLYLNPVCLREIKGLTPPVKGRSAEAILAIGERAEKTQIIRLVPTSIDYWICTSFQRERLYRNYCITTQPNRSQWDSYRALAERFPCGLADSPELPEEASGQVQSAWIQRRRRI
jgi:type IV secretory pathway VirB4 component